MLCPAVLAELEAATPVEKRILPQSGDAASAVGSDELAGSEESFDQGSSTATTVSMPSTNSEPRIGVPKDLSGLAPGTNESYNSIEKWVLAALRELGKTPLDLLLPSMEPNDALVAQVHRTIEDWRLAETTAQEAGVVDDRPHILASKPPQQCLVLCRAWTLRHINTKRAEKDISVIPDPNWGRNLAGVKAGARAVNKDTSQKKAESGALFHHRHNVAPKYEELMAMTRVGFTGDQRVHADILDSMEAGMAMALYMQTGARGGELKKMHIQSLGHQEIQDTDLGATFHCLQLVAFETKTKAVHLNQTLAHSNPWSCAVGLLGVSLLIRVKMYGPMPFTMQMKKSSWMIFGTNIKTLDDRVRNVYDVAGVLRQIGDVLLNLGRGHGSRLLQHAGGSEEGGKARRGHGSSETASKHYIGAPLPDLQKLAGCFFNGKPFVPAHQKPELFPFADAVLLILFPELDAEEKAVKTRQREVAAMRGMSDKVRTEEQLNDRERLLRSIRFACRMALCCLVARPRSWMQWEIMKDESSVWQRAGDDNHRVVKALFGRDKPAIDAMCRLALEVIRLENAEITARLASPDNSNNAAVASAVYQVGKEAAADRANTNAILKAVSEALMDVKQSNGNGVPIPLVIPPPPAEAPPTEPPMASSATTDALSCARIKHKRESQDDVCHFSSWLDLGDCLAYTKSELVPQEVEHGSKWRIIKREDGRSDRSRNKHWRCYRNVALSVGILMRNGKTYEEAVSLVQEQFKSFKSHTTFLNTFFPTAPTGMIFVKNAINGAIEQMRDSEADVIVRKVLGF